MDRLVNTDYSDNRFEQMGVELQMDANSWQAAKQDYERSCMLCCTNGCGANGCGAIQCAHCKIREAMLVNARIFRKKMSDKDKEWVEKERELR